MPSPVTRADLAVISVWVLVALMSWLIRGSAGSGGPLRAVVSIEGGQSQEVLLISTEEMRHLQVDGPIGTTHIEFAAGRTRVAAAPCRQKVCQRSGWLSAPGDLAACIPNGIVVRIVGRRGDGIDGITR